MSSKPQQSPEQQSTQHEHGHDHAHEHHHHDGCCDHHHGKIGRNDPCICGSGKKYKKCCLHGSDSVL